jgi:hypothetical protein
MFQLPNYKVLIGISREVSNDSRFDQVQAVIEFRVIEDSVGAQRLLYLKSASYLATVCS